MGESTLSDIVENVANLGEGKLSTEIGNLFESNEKSHSLNGWTLQSVNDCGYPMCGRKKLLYADVATKGEKVVRLLNTSKYAAVGDYWYVVFSKDRSAVEEFLKDFGLNDTTIEDMDSVCQTL